jgi:hypothetical protein
LFEESENSLTQQTKSSISHSPPAWLAGVLLSLLLLAMLLAWVSTGFESLSGWPGFAAVLAISLVLALGVWRGLRSEHLPRWLGALLLVAFLLRMLAGTAWFVLLPNLGHGTIAERGGYIMADAGARDQVAWHLAKSEKPLWSAFADNRKVDQYGGLLFLSALVYRYLGSGFIQPLLIVVLAAAVSSLALLFTWAFARRAWGERAAWLAVGILAIYPDAVLLGSSQMREAFMITLTSAAFYGLLSFQQSTTNSGQRSFGALAWLVGALVLFLPFSPVFAALLMGTLVLFAFLTSGFLTRSVQNKRHLWLILGAMGILAFIGLWLALKQFTPAGMNNPITMLNWWVRKSAGLQAFLSRHSSGWMQQIFHNTPDWTHLPMLIGYGILQPFLPAALVAGSEAPIWQWIAIWRAVGWAVMLAFLVYAPLLLLQRSSRPDSHRIARAVLVIIWLVILVTAFRGGSDQWDNPRYRATYAGLAACLAAWAWVEHRQVSDPWLRRALLGFTAVLAWFVPWYLRRYYSIPWEITDPFKTMGLGLISVALIALWDWARPAPSPQVTSETALISQSE